MIRYLVLHFVIESGIGCLHCELQFCFVVLLLIMAYTGVLALVLMYNARQYQVSVSTVFCAGVHCCVICRDCLEVGLASLNPVITPTYKHKHKELADS